MMQPDEVRRAVEKVLERPMPDVVWSRLNNEDLSHEFAAIGPEGLAREAEHLIGFLAHQYEGRSKTVAVAGRIQ